MDNIANAKHEIARWLAELLPTGEISCAEVGVKQGHLASCWLTACPMMRLYLIDRWKPADPECDYARIGDPAALATAETHDAWKRETLMRMDPFAGDRFAILHNESSPAAAALLHEHVELDAVFLYADHSYSGRLADLRAWSPLVKPGGLVAGGLWHSSYGGFCGRNALHHHLPREQLQASDVIRGPAETWAFVRAGNG